MCEVFTLFVCVDDVVELGVEPLRVCKFTGINLYIIFPCLCTVNKIVAGETLEL